MRANALPHRGTPNDMESKLVASVGPTTIKLDSPYVAYVTRNSEAGDPVTSSGSRSLRVVELRAYAAAAAI
jgi:hypothetical protein